MITPEGTRLTEAHRLAQLRNAGEAIRLSRAVWNVLDVRDLDASAPVWLRAQLPILRRFNRRSRDLAATYLREFKRAETGGEVAIVPGGLLDDIAALVSLEVTGPSTLKRGLGMGRTETTASNVAFKRLAGTIHRHVAHGGRATVERSAEQDRDARGWRRVARPGACEFCAMVASRGPVYGTRDRALASGGGRSTSRAAGSRYHDNCGCTVAPAYGAWVPSESERQWADLYNKSMVPGDMRATLRNMRRAMNRG